MEPWREWIFIAVSFLTNSNQHSWGLAWLILIIILISQLFLPQHGHKVTTAGREQQQAGWLVSSKLRWGPLQWDAYSITYLHCQPLGPPLRSCFNLMCHLRYIYPLKVHPDAKHIPGQMWQGLCIHLLGQPLIQPQPDAPICHSAGI